MLRSPLQALAVVAVGLSPWFGAAAATLAESQPEPTPAGPEPALVAPAEVIQVYDGDTITVRMTLDLRLRLLDCWAPEVRTRDPEEKRHGLAAKAHLEELLAGRRVTVAIPFATARRLDDVLTLGRVLGRVWVDGAEVSPAMVEAGHATRERPRKGK